MKHLLLFFNLILFGCAKPQVGLWNKPNNFANENSLNDEGTVNPIHMMVRKKILLGFKFLSNGDYTNILDQMDDNIHYRFSGNHALGGERFSKNATELWFKRLTRLFQSDFRIYKIEISGPPWDMLVVTQFSDFAKPKSANCSPYVNPGIQIAKLRFDKIVDVITYVDTKKIITALDCLASNGVTEAGLPPIEG
ncbi:MAG: hypothetical protein HOP07_05760 [Bacteriovoracaceae bacterium]|nr:hypothetical protein [Bacteriovoracaceae bacterium]